MSIHEMITVLANNGIMFVVTAMVLYFLFKIGNVLFAKFERKMITQHSKDLKEKRPQTIEKNNIIQQLLYKAMYEFGGDRAYIFEYHNGGHSISGIDFLKASNTYEVVKGTVQPQQLMMQNLPVGVFAFWNMKVLQKQIICRNVEDISKEDLGAYQVLKQQGVTSLYIIGLYDAKGYPIGFLGIDYIKGTMPQMEDEKHREIERLSYQISGLLY